MDRAEESAKDSIESSLKGANADWVTVALRAGRWLAKRQETMTSEDIWDAISTHYPKCETPEPRAMGAIMRRIAKQGYIFPTDKTVKSGKSKNHNRPQRVWKSRLYYPPSESSP
jgi:hypothetical protein